MIVPDSILQHHIEKIDEHLSVARPLLEYLRRTSESGLRDLFQALTSLSAAAAHIEALREQKDGD